MPLRYKVRDGRALKGTIRPAGNKNAALPILAATLLADGPCELENVPRIRDVESMLELLAHLGATVEWFGPNAVRIDTKGVQAKPLDPRLCARIGLDHHRPRPSAGAFRPRDPSAARR
jgi:UDP-N-acetylglucosamine 1-carboxyvinyltransferase